MPPPSTDAPALSVLAYARDGDTLVHDAALDHDGYVQLWSVRTGGFRRFVAERVRAHLAREGDAAIRSTALAAYRSFAAAQAPPAPRAVPGTARVVPRRAPTAPRDRIDPDNPGHAAALRALARREPLLVTGRAGTGKSTFLRALVAQERGRAAVVAPTGLAALNAGGQTVHGFFGLAARVQGPDADAPPPSRARRALLAALDTLVVDEASMVRADLLDAMDRALRQARDPDAPFGGVRLVLVGDPWQLPPVVPDDDRPLLAALGYPREAHVFDAHALGGGAGAAGALRLVEFTHVYRQRDPHWLALLDRVRDAALDAPTLAALAGRVAPADVTELDDTIVLCARRGRATELNERRLALLAGRVHRFDGVRSGRWASWEATPAPEALALVRGARVMCVRNDPEGAWVNGSLGTVVGFVRDTHVEVELDTGVRVRVGRTTWERTRYVLDEATGRLATEVTGRFTQHPLALAWATTIHKAQGLTFDRVHLDLGRGAFAPGQTYVALSRCRTLEGVSLERALLRSDVTTDPRVVAFFARTPRAA